MNSIIVQDDGLVARQETGTFADLERGEMFLRESATGEIDLCIKLAYSMNCRDQWNTVYVAGDCPGRPCYTDDNCIPVKRFGVIEMPTSTHRK